MKKAWKANEHNLGEISKKFTEMVKAITVSGSPKYFTQEFLDYYQVHQQEFDQLLDIQDNIIQFLDNNEKLFDYYGYKVLGVATVEDDKNGKTIYLLHIKADSTHLDELVYNNLVNLGNWLPSGGTNISFMTFEMEVAY